MFALLASCTVEYEPHNPVPPSYIPQEIVPHEPEWWEDRITQVPTPKLNLLFIVDDSCSMGDDQEQLAIEMPPLIETIDAANVDYRIGITSAGGTGRLTKFNGQSWIDRTNPDPVGAFSSGVVGLGLGGERGLHSMYSVFTQDKDVPQSGQLRT